MNYCLDFSIRVEDELLRLISAVCAETGKTNDEITVEEENVLYQKALETIIDQDEGRTIASGNVRIGEIILIIDSDTRVVSQMQFQAMNAMLNNVARRLFDAGCIGNARKP
jgi:hypothetical protein